MSDIVLYDPWHGDGALVAPHRPSLDQLGGGAYLDDATDPPDLDTMPSAAMENANQRALAGVARVCAVVKISVSFAGGTPSVNRVTCADRLLGSGDFSVTDNGDGDTSIEWAPDALPPAATAPSGLTMNEINTVERTAAVEITNGVRVYTRDGTGTGVDTDFTVTIN